MQIPTEHEANVFGQLDTYAKKIERTFHVTLIERNGEIKIMGEEGRTKRAQEILEKLLELSRRGNVITEQNVNYLISLAMEDEAGDVLEMDKEVIAYTVQGKPVKAKTLGQKSYVDAMKKDMIVFGLGPAGTGKTYLAMAMAIAAFKTMRSQGLF